MKLSEMTEEHLFFHFFTSSEMENKRMLRMWQWREKTMPAHANEAAKRIGEIAGIMFVTREVLYEMKRGY